MMINKVPSPIMDQRHGFIYSINANDIFLDEKVISIVLDWNIQHKCNKNFDYFQYFKINARKNLISGLRQENLKNREEFNFLKTFYFLYNLIFFPFVMNKNKLIIMDSYKIEKNFKVFKYFIANEHQSVEPNFMLLDTYLHAKNKFGMFLNENIIVPNWFLQHTSSPSIFKIEENIDFSKFDESMKTVSEKEKIQIFTLEILHVLKSLHFWAYAKDENIFLSYQHIKNISFKLDINAYEIIQNSFGLNPENMIFANCLNNSFEEKSLFMMNFGQKSNKIKLL